MYKKILVGLDGSIHGLAATRSAVELAKRFDAEVHLLTVTRPYKVSQELQRYLKAENLLGEPKYVMDEMTENIIKEARDITKNAGLPKVKEVVREGKPARSLVAYAKNNHVDLIVVGSRGIGEEDPVLLGSVSEKVGMLAHCAVMIVR